MQDLSDERLEQMAEEARLTQRPEYPAGDVLALVGEVRRHRKERATPPRRPSLEEVVVRKGGR